ncbi:sensor histidine kinase [Erythrobacter sp. BLCC-B19]|uniref:sensor histidine kinase n=1 Tax=Erythrobacter sp. BLCC-B19 TaxID=3025315 RepID=UPI00235DC956|nr:ATP-binding protein [Erythrobacter sp. BLCC-B19]WDA39806.1 histidine kinase [Erythrobacter sp. BLCC-B19]
MNLSPRMRSWLLAALFLLFSQMLFWPLVDFAERITRPDEIDPRGEITFTALDENRKVIAGGEVFTAKRQKQQGYYAPLVPGAAYARFAIPFDVADPQAPTGFYMSLRDDVAEVRLNGMIAQPEVTVSRQQGSVNVGPHFVPLPPAALRKGANLLELDVRVTGTVNDFPTFAIGDADALARAHRWRTFMLLDLPLAGIALQLFTVLLCAVVVWPREDRPRINAIMLLLGLSAASTAVLSYIPPTWPFAITIGLYVLSSAGIGLAAIHYAQSDGAVTLVPERALRWAWLALPVLVAVPMAWGHLEPASAPALIAATVKASFWFVSALCALAALLLALAAARGGMAAWFERMVLTVSFCFFILDRLGSIFELHSLFDASLPLTLPWSPIVGVPLGLSMILSLARQASEARRTVVRSNEILAAQLTEQNAKLEASYEAQKQLLQREVMLVERQRIVRDMHDGIGGQLLGLMMQVRGGGASPVEVEQGLQASIADLRLIVDSMDSAEEGLAETMRSFEHRVRPQVEAAGIALDFVAEVDESLDLGPRPTLQLLRILQEAVTNAMRHSRARRIAVAGSAGAQGPIRITISDNGTGLPEGYRRGRGLTSMETRARNLGGALTIVTGSEGTCLTLEVPVTAPDPSA